MKKIIHLSLFCSLLISSSLLAKSNASQLLSGTLSDPDNKTLHEETKQNSIFKKRGMESILTIAQLQEMLHHVEDDLYQLEYLNRRDIPEIEAVLLKKRDIIIHHLEDLENNIKHYELNDDSLTFTEILTVLSCFAVVGIAVTGSAFGLKYLKENYPVEWHNVITHLPSFLQ